MPKNWNRTTTLVNAYSGNWQQVYLDSGKWNNTYTTLNINSVTCVYLANAGSPIGAGATTSVGLGTFL